MVELIEWTEQDEQDLRRLLAKKWEYDTVNKAKIAKEWQQALDNMRKEFDKNRPPIDSFPKLPDDIPNYKDYVFSDYVKFWPKNTEWFMKGPTA